MAEDPRVEQITFKVKHIIPDGLQTYLVEQVLIQNQPDKFILSFFEVFPPPIFGENDEETLRLLKETEHVEAKCVSRIIMTPAAMNRFHSAINENIQNYQKTTQLNKSASHKNSQEG